MTDYSNPDNEFKSTIDMLVAEIEDCIRVTESCRDREYDFQHQAFKERCEQAIKLAGRLQSDGHRVWSMQSGDAHRIRESLQTSLAYFRGQLDS